MDSKKPACLIKKNGGRGREISRRILAVSEMINDLAGRLFQAGYRPVLCDVGTDHGILPIYLLQNKAIEKSIAVDIGEKPLRKAQNNSLECGVDELIDIRLSDGLSKVDKGEAEVFSICGMGGGVIKKILKEALDRGIIHKGAGFVVSPQSTWMQLREFMYENGFNIVRESFIYDNGKVYRIIEAVYDGQKREVPLEVYEYGDFTGDFSGISRLKDYLIAEKRSLKLAFDGICRAKPCDETEKKKKELRKKIAVNEKALMEIIKING